MPLVRNVLLTRRLVELAPIPGRKARVPFDLEIDLRQQQFVGERKRSGVELPAADDEDPLRVPDQPERVLE